MDLGRPEEQRAREAERQVRAVADTPEMEAALDAGMASLGWPKGLGPDHFRDAIRVALKVWDGRAPGAVEPYPETDVEGAVAFVRAMMNTEGCDPGPREAITTAETVRAYKVVNAGLAALAARPRAAPVLQQPSESHAEPPESDGDWWLRRGWESAPSAAMNEAILAGLVAAGNSQASGEPIRHYVSEACRAAIEYATKKASETELHHQGEVGADAASMIDRFATALGLPKLGPGVFYSAMALTNEIAVLRTRHEAWCALEMKTKLNAQQMADRLAEVEALIGRAESAEADRKASALNFASAKDECHLAREELRTLQNACRQLVGYCLANGDYHREPTESGAAYEDVAKRIQALIKPKAEAAPPPPFGVLPITFQPKCAGCNGTEAEHPAPSCATFVPKDFGGGRPVPPMETVELRQRLERSERAIRALCSSSRDVDWYQKTVNALRELDMSWEKLSNDIVTDAFVNRTGRHPIAGDSALLPAVGAFAGAVVTMGEDGVWRGQPKEAPEAEVSNG